MSGSTNFPGSFDSFGDVATNATVATPHINDLRRAVEAIEVKLGHDNDPATSCVDYLTKSAGSLDPGHKHTKADGATDVSATAGEIDRACDSSINGFFDAGEKIWMYEATAPTGWTYVSPAADSVLAVKGGSQAYNASGGSMQGTWQKLNHTLTKSELPTHVHRYDRSQYLVWYWDVYISASIHGGYSGFNTGNGAVDGLGGGAHNHGNTQRYYAAVGIIISKAT